MNAHLIAEINCGARDLGIVTNHNDTDTGAKNIKHNARLCMHALTCMCAYVCGMRHCHSHSYAKGLDTLRQLGSGAGQGRIGQGLDTATRTHAHAHPPPGPRFLAGGGAMGGLRAERNAYRGTHFYAKSQKVMPTRTRKGPLRSYGCMDTRSEAEGSPRPC